MCGFLKKLSHWLPIRSVFSVIHDNLVKLDGDVPHSLGTSALNDLGIKLTMF